MHFLSALDLNQYTKRPSPYYILYRGKRLEKGDLFACLSKKGTQE